ncbi:hypothetical protein DM02DRAFT_652348 [Periconia macrospinosa]|uniref:Rhodopsin domain-containing protein n=1 Tax=Periconia macrospinosa TaxID=97972 RepID=A0A2V1E3I4_9PLEO|nr:hypothetical protein DM02DRAFT_652348 [Periconia macrospinosa]
MNTHRYFAREEFQGVVPAPPGSIANPTNPPSIAHHVVAANIAFPLLSTVFLALRWYTSLCILQRVGFEEYTITIAWIMALGHAATSCILTRYGLGRHLWDVSFVAFNNNFGKAAIIGGLSYTLAIMFVKISILVFYLRISAARNLKIVIYTAVAITIAYSIPLATIGFYACNPMAKYWDITITTGSCINQYAVYLFSASMNIATDVIILVLPVVMLWKVHIPRRQKVGIIFMLMTGGLVLVASIVRLVHIVNSFYTTDITWDFANQDVWWALELHLAIVCSCLPLGKAFLRCHFPQVIGRSSQDSHSHPRTRRTFRSTHQVALPSREENESKLSSEQGKTTEGDFPLHAYSTQPNNEEDGGRKTSFCDARLDAEQSCKVWGKEHPDTLTSTKDLALTFNGQGSVWRPLLALGLA